MSGRRDEFLDQDLSERDMGVECVIFDIDGVLIDTAKMVAAGQLYVCQRMGLSTRRPQDELLEIWRDLAVAIGGEVTPAFAECLVQECMLRGLQIQPDIDVLGTFFEGYWTHVGAVNHVMDSVKALRARNICLGVLSNGIYEEQMKKLGLAALSDLFNPSFIEIHQSNDRFAKPNPAMLRNLIGKMDAKPVKTAYIGDRVSDILTANLCGCVSVLFSDDRLHPNVNESLRMTRDVSSSRLEIARPDIAIASLVNLDDILERWNADATKEPKS